MDALLVDNFYLKQKENIYLININETELACAGQTYLEYFLPGTPLLTSHPPPPWHKRRKTNDNKNKNNEVLEEGHFSIHVIVTT